MWCIRTIDKEYRKRMYDILDLYGRKNRQFHVIAIDEKPKQVVSDKRKPIPMKPGSPERYDYEYVRKGTRNIFVAVEPRAGKRITKVTKRRTKKDFAMFVKLVLDRYPKAKKLYIILDNLNTHFASSFIETFGEEQAKRLLKRIEFHYTPNHASWLNVAEIEINVMDMECTDRRFKNVRSLEQEVGAWTRRRNRDRKKIKWGFDQKQADKKLSKYYV
jgi:hypothetical protein